MKADGGLDIHKRFLISAALTHNNTFKPEWGRDISAFMFFNDYLETLH
jgi:hypothetical protein